GLRYIGQRGSNAPGRRAAAHGPVSSLRAGITMGYRTTMGCVENAGGQTTARVFGRTHSQMTLVAVRLAPASECPDGAKNNPLPLGSAPGGSRICPAARATASGV